MKGIILAGGTGSRLHPMTKVTNKHLLPVYDRPMVMWPIETLKKAGITEMMIVSGRGHAGHFMELLESGREYGVKLSYAIQENAGGIAEALSCAEDFADGGSVAVILGDNIYENSVIVNDFKEGARIYLKKVGDPERFGVATLEGEKVVKVIEKPKEPETNYAVTGLYLYDYSVFNKIKNLDYSERGELEITDVNNLYINEGNLEAQFIDGFWTDAGTVESLYKASVLIKDKHGDK